ncbi:MAG: phosphomannomutase/phosphoglucomutase [Oligoflexia bacterium]|nr:phosphomannomutase/phosphoglucomutase [Oligoflexia bacterium]
MMNEEIFREYDIRGVVDKDFDPQFAAILGKAYATYLKQNNVKAPSQISVGYDARLSSTNICEFLCKGLTSSGVNVLNLGLITTPLSYFSTFTLPISGAIMITGSHNPPDYNGFKISLGKSTIFGDEIQKLKKIILEKDFIKPATEGTVKIQPIFTSYVERYSNDFKMGNPVKVVVDCGNGAAGVITRKLFDKLGITCEILFEEPDGRFPNHHPDPTIEANLTHLKKRVIETGAVCGIGFDGDADRIGVMDHTGRLLYGDELMVIFSRSVLAKFPGTAIIGDVKCSDRLYKDIEAHKGKAVMYKTGHSLIKSKMKEMGSLFSGEMSGHVFFADRNYGYDDAIYAGARLIEILSQTGKNIPQLLEGLPPAFSTPEIRIDTTEVKKRSIVEEMRKQFCRPPYIVNEIDGIRISFDDGFALVRSSNTQPVIVCRFEATSPTRLKEIRQLVEGALKSLL